MRLHKFLVIYGVVITVRFAMIYTHDMLLILTQTLQMYNYHGSSRMTALVALSSCPKWQRACPYGLPQHFKLCWDSELAQRQFWSYCKS
ncbi:hypothetical protein GUITHDRAFT_103411 [Guillardia theta CCMP2712]|uniref:Uncharacterized protein n=1 Tax=Guillardia theta (strain CCMP2712) TaxID=905079 RepID=L1JQJ1_GUITC|nr:hypothetical protein GUITHDRAFT_103411 [Guillardia theta CCMP2712]EKX50821.1 hypothetical protein GUITHDRAFT_103411 [Guillardia theta CCMP2712]|eukprot:XP_005837801.1 hypothetical protein GUITHDRAFT_103411 [Guillardia theta CCMP2712]